MSDFIPQEVMTNILKRLPIKDLVRCRSVSKHWLAIIDTPHFISCQLHHSISTNFNSALFFQTTMEGVTYYTRGRRSPNEIPDLPDKLILMGSCHGLVCFVLVDCNLHSMFGRIFIPQSSYVLPQLLLLNPTTGERCSCSVDSFITKEQVPKMAAYGFGYDEISEDYKVVRIMQSASGFHDAEIYCVRGKAFSSTTIHFPVAKWLEFEQRVGKFVCGALHWCNYDADAHRFKIRAIDLGSETIRELAQPNYSFKKKGACFLNIGVLDSSRLCVCAFHKAVNETDVWVMKEYGKVESWSMIYCFKNFIWPRNLPVNSVIPVGSIGRQILLMFARCRFAVCDPDTKRVTFVKSDRIGNPGSNIREAVYCLESLVKIFPNNEEGDNAQSNSPRLVCKTGKFCIFFDKDQFSNEDLFTRRDCRRHNPTGFVDIPSLLRALDDINIDITIDD
ncbi:F-box/kelch-repeat protein At3g23880 [Linum perenne]